MLYKILKTLTKIIKSIQNNLYNNKEVFDEKLWGITGYEHDLNVTDTKPFFKRNGLYQ